MKPFFIEIPNFWAWADNLSRQFGQTNLGAFGGIFGRTISTNFWYCEFLVRQVLLCTFNPESCWCCGRRFGQLIKPQLIMDSFIYFIGFVTNYTFCLIRSSNQAGTGRYSVLGSSV